MKITSRNIEHAWLHGLKDRGRARNVRFEGADIYSYGTIIGRVVVRPVDPLKPGLVLVNVRKYSVTTGGHQAGVRGAIPQHWIRLTYEGRSNGYSYGDGDPGEVSALILAQWDGHRKALKAMGHESEAAARADLAYTHRLQGAAKLVGGRKLARVRSFDLDAFGAALPWADHAQRWEKAEAIARRRSDAAYRAAATRRAAQRETDKANAAERLAKWRAGESVWGWISNKIALRLAGDKVETSNGADISAAAARLILAAWRGGKLLPGQHAGAYAVNEVAEDHIVAGCTRIDRDEAEAFAAAQGW